MNRPGGWLRSPSKNRRVSFSARRGMGDGFLGGCPRLAAGVISSRSCFSSGGFSSFGQPMYCLRLGLAGVVVKRARSGGVRVVRDWRKFFQDLDASGCGRAVKGEASVTAAAAVRSFFVDGGRDAAWRCCDRGGGRTRRVGSRRFFGRA